MDKSELISKYKKGFQLLAEKINGLPPDLIDYKLTASKWSIREIVAHLLDCEASCYIRIRTAIAENGSTVATFNQNKWSDTLNYEAHNLDDDLELIKLLRKNTTKLLLTMPEESWGNHFIHPERGKITLFDYIVLVCEHLDSHIKQIAKNYEQSEKTEKRD
jgi:hypothetical protein